jgi:TPR repeat protein
MGDCEGQVGTSAEPSAAELSAAFEALGTTPRRALDQLIRWAEGGSAHAMIYVGRAYWYGYGVPVNCLTAEQWFRRAADEGLSLGHFFLGGLYSDRRRYDEAISEYKIAVGANYPPALHQLGRMYFYGDGVDRDLTIAGDLLERATVEGNLAAKLQFAHLLKSGARGVFGMIRGVFLQMVGMFQVMAIYRRDGPQSDRFW